MIWLQIYLIGAGIYMLLAWRSFNKLFRDEKSTTLEKVLLVVAIGSLWFLVLPYGIIRRLFTNEN